MSTSADGWVDTWYNSIRDNLLVYDIRLRNFAGKGGCGLRFWV